MPTTASRFDAAALGLPVEGYRLVPGTFRDQLDEGGTLVVFLRHLGCIFCREVVADLRDAAGRSGLPPILFVHPAKVAEGDEFFAKFFPEAKAVSDPDCTLYEAFGIGRGGLGELFSPSVWACGFRAMKRGHGVGKVAGDPWRMPGFFLLRDGEIAWEHRSRHAADHPDFSSLPAELAALA